MSRRGAPARPQHATNDPQALLLRQLQKALAIAGCIRLAVEYGENGELDIADAVAGLLVLLEGAADMLDRSEAAL